MGVQISKLIEQCGGAQYVLCLPGAAQLRSEMMRLVPPQRIVFQAKVPREPAVTLPVRNERAVNRCPVTMGADAAQARYNAGHLTRRPARQACSAPPPPPPTPHPSPSPPCPPPPPHQYVVYHEHPLCLLACQAGAASNVNTSTPHHR